MKKMILFTEEYFPKDGPIPQILYKIIKNLPTNKNYIFSKRIKNTSVFLDYLIVNNDEIKIFINEILYKKSFFKKRKIISKVLDILLEKYSNLKYNIHFLCNLNKKYDIVMTSSMSRGYHKYGALYKIFYPNVKWIAFFSDPYSNSPFDEYSSKIKKDNIYILKKIYKIFLKLNFQIMKYFYKLEENIVFKYADKIIYVSEAQKEFCYKGKDEKNQIIIFPFYYLSEWKNKIEKNIRVRNRYNKNRINFIHPGNIYGNRKPDEFFKALKYFENKIHYYNCGYFDTSLITEYSLKEVITSFGSVNYEILLENIKEADYVIVIDSFFKDIKNPYMPSKVVDAMYFNKPIIAITDENTELDKFCKITGNISIRNNVEIIRIKLAELITEDFKVKPDYSMYCDLKFDII